MPLDPILEQIAAGGGFAPMDEDLAILHAERAAARALALANRSRTKVKRTQDRQIEGREGPIGVRIYWPDTDSAAPAPLVVFYHGGGFARGDLETHDPVARAISAKAEAVVVAVDYRLAPEHPYPAAAHDSFDALLWSHEHAAELGADPGRIAVAGDSAGGNLAAVVTQLARDAGGPPLKFQLLWYPAVTFDLSLPSAEENAHGPLLTRKDMELYGRFYLGDTATGAPADLPATAAPVNGNLAGLPPAYIATAQYDPIRDDGTTYAKLLAEAGVPVELHNAETLAHGYVSFAAAVPVAKEARDRSLAALKAAL
ncbi:Alpha/beta hydrolase fold-3 domain protein [Segniliparus rotundus DSM 44985]|uniref:Alpha/beta hydrolase fold-3 domain protein n=1 Tax=Segniliparus rotundus (strain ATCC BAA-972 / CDC 1076 / CIP 108378 / DSM 44985 / JCM 13578) TaxID=640132 RepID=D6Z914_SEGRD|nr:alpha/beta hydrolase [Segniliparus rotundus]ADG98444.1 Alpha/beta hydrolase fold-3 domain protein [Segniliparus rotundus DSM 44985]